MSDERRSLRDMDDAELDAELAYASEVEVGSLLHDGDEAAAIARRRDVGFVEGPERSPQVG